MNNLQKFREERNLTREQLSKASQVSEEEIERLEIEESGTVNSRTLKSLADALGVKISDFFTETIGKIEVDNTNDIRTLRFIVNDLRAAETALSMTAEAVLSDLFDLDEIHDAIVALFDFFTWKVEKISDTLDSIERKARALEEMQH